MPGTQLYAGKRDERPPVAGLSIAEVREEREREALRQERIATDRQRHDLLERRTSFAVWIALTTIGIVIGSVLAASGHPVTGAGTGAGVELVSHAINWLRRSLVK